MKITVFLISLLIFCSCIKKADEKILVSSSKNESKEISSNGTKSRVEIQDIDYSTYFKEALEYCKNNNYNKNFFFLIDIGKHSGLKRFFVYDFKKDKVVKSYMVSHGCGDASWGGTMTKDAVQISNVPDSHCSSIGKYIISSRGVSQWGIKVNYLMLGKGKTNSNALSRAIVLHSWNAVSENEVYPDGTPEGWGCPAVSNESMKEIDELLKTNKKVLMWIIKS